MQRDRAAGKLDRIFEPDALPAVCAEWEAHLKVDRIQESSYQTGWSMAMPLVHATTKAEGDVDGADRPFARVRDALCHLLRRSAPLAGPLLRCPAGRRHGATFSSTLPPLHFGGDWGAALQAYGHLPATMKTAPICFALTLDEICRYSRGHAEVLEYDDAALVGTNLLSTVFLEDQVTLRQWMGEWLAGVAKRTAPSMLQGIPVKRIHKRTGARVQMTSSAVLLNVESGPHRTIIVVAETP